MIRRHKLVFTASLLLNVVFIGMLAGHSLHIWRWLNPDSYVNSLLSRLPADKHTLVKRTMREADKDFEGLHHQLIETRKSMTATLKAPSFDAAAYREQAQKMQELIAAMNNDMVNASVTLAGQLSPDERLLFADYMEGMRRNEWRKKDAPAPSGAVSAP